MTEQPFLRRSTAQISVEIDGVVLDDNVKDEEQDPVLYDIPEETSKWRAGFKRMFPILLAMLAAVFFSMMQLFVKIVSVYTPTVQVAFSRSIIQGLLAVTVLGIQERTTVFNLSRRILWIVISRGAIGFVSFLCLFFALSKLPLSECVVITYTHPVFASILAAVTLGEKMHSLDIVGILFSTAGVIFISKPPFLFPGAHDDVEDPEDRWIGLGLAGANSLLTAVVICLIRKMGSGIHVLQNVAWFSIVSSILSGIILCVTRDFYMPQGLVQWTQLLTLGIFSFLGQFCYSRSLQLEKAAIIASTGYLQVVFAVVFDLVLLDFVPDIWSLLGVSLICCLALLSLAKQWTGAQSISIFEKLRLLFMKRSTVHEPLSQNEELQEMK